LIRACIARLIVSFVFQLALFAYPIHISLRLLAYLHGSAFSQPNSFTAATAARELLWLPTCVAHVFGRDSASQRHPGRVHHAPGHWAHLFLSLSCVHEANPSVTRLPSQPLAFPGAVPLLTEEITNSQLNPRCYHISPSAVRNYHSWCY
jgi:hypothetical protein